MLDVFKFIFKCIAQMISMLFTIDLGFMSLGMLMCVVFIFLPLFLSFINFLKYLGDDFDFLDSMSSTKGDKKRK